MPPDRPILSRCGIRGQKKEFASIPKKLCRARPALIKTVECKRAFRGGIAAPPKGISPPSSHSSALASLRSGKMMPSMSEATEAAQPPPAKRDANASSPSRSVARHTRRGGLALL